MNTDHTAQADPKKVFAQKLNAVALDQQSPTSVAHQFVVTNHLA